MARFSSFFIAIVGLISGARAAIIPQIDVPTIVSDADMIVVGRAVSTAWSVDAPEVFIVRADRVLKNSGTPLQGQIVVQLAPHSPGYRWVAEGQYGIFALYRPTSGQPYTVVDPFYPVLPAAPLQTDSQQPSDPLVAVTQELARVFAAPGAALLDPTTGVQALVSAPPSEQVQWLYHETAAALATVPFGVSAPSLQAMIGSNAILARLWGMNVLLSMGASTGLESVKSSTLKHLVPTLMNPDPDVALSVSMVGSAMLGRMISPQNVPTLTNLLSSTDPGVRRAAAGNLSRIGTYAVVAPLAQVALNDPNPDVRYYAVSGLAKATGIAPRPTRASYDASENDMLSFWAEWTKKNFH
jgi:hypothetical protein